MRKPKLLPIFNKKMQKFSPYTFAKNIYKPQKCRKYKAQVELIGISIVVMLVVILFLFAAAFLSGVEKSQFKPIEDRKKVSAFLATSIESTTSCQKYILKQLIEDCALGRRLFCPESSCDYIKNFFRESINFFFDEREYYFSITGTEDVKMELGDICTGEREGKDLSVYVRSFPITLHLELCR